MIDVRCQSCKKWLKIDERFRGQTGQCAQCGAPIKVPKKSPFGIIAMSVVGTICGLGLIGALVNPPKESARDRVSAPSNAPRSLTEAVAAPSAPAPLPISSITFEQIRNQMKGATSIQWSDFTKPLKGQRVQWSGWIVEARQKTFGGYEVWIDMDPPNTPLSVQDVSFDVTAEVARSLSKGQRVAFTGTITSIVDVFSSCQINLKDARLN